MLDAIANESIAVSKRRFGLLPSHANRQTQNGNATILFIR